MPGNAQFEQAFYPIKGPANLDVYLSTLGGQTVNGWMRLGRVDDVVIEETRDKDTLTEVVEGATIPLEVERTTQEARLRFTSKEPMNPDLLKLVFGAGATQVNLPKTIYTAKELITLEFDRNKKVRLPYAILPGLYPEPDSCLGTPLNTGGSILPGTYAVSIIGVYDDAGAEESWPATEHESYDMVTTVGAGAVNKILAEWTDPTEGQPKKWRIYMGDDAAGVPATGKNRTLIQEVDGSVHALLILAKTGPVTTWAAQPISIITLKTLDGITTFTPGGIDYTFDTDSGEIIGVAGGPNDLRRNVVYMLTYAVTRAEGIESKAGPLVGPPTFRKLRLLQLRSDPGGGAYAVGREVTIFKATPDTESASLAFQDDTWDGVGQEYAFSCLYDGGERAIYKVAVHGEGYAGRQVLEP